VLLFAALARCSEVTTVKQQGTRSRHQLAQPDDVRHLLRRLTFAATPDAERTITGKGVDDALRSLVSTTTKAAIPQPPPFATKPWTNTALRTPGMTSQEYQQLRIGQAAASERDVEELRHWWLREMVSGPAPLRENLVLFFQGTIGSSTFGDAPQALHGVNALMRRSVLGTIPALLEQLMVDPAMILQLGIDEYRRDKDNKLFERPARLLLDNWTVGAGEYTESDVANLSRALTGWILLPPKGQESRTPVDPEAFRSARRTGLVPTFEPQHFEAGAKTILGRTEDFDSRSAIRFLARQPATARRYSRLLIAYFGVEDSDRRLETQLTDTYRATDGSVAALLREIVRSEQFWTAESRWALIKSPIHLVVGACRQLGITEPPLSAISQWLVATGQRLLNTPNFGDGGWSGQEAWVNPPDRLAVRYQLGSVLSGRLPDLGIRPVPSAHPPAPSPAPGMRLQPATVAAVVARLDPAPGVDLSAIEQRVSHVAAEDRSAEAVRHILSTMQYQMA
jgi:uncharacterized protein (DUF1800 family)